MNDAARRHRSPRDWAVDTALFLLALGYASALYLFALDEPGRQAAPLHRGYVLSVGACGLVWLRRSWPTAAALILIPVSTVDDFASGAQLVALLTVAIHRPVRIVVLVCSLRVLAVAVYVPLRAPPDVPAGWVVALATVTSLGVVGWGLFVRHRRQLIASLSERAERAEAEATWHAERAQHQVREQIAREMHDVLGHRLSLLSVYAGALEYRQGVDPDQVARAAGVIRAGTHQAMQDLREVLAVLRAPVGELPQPTYADLPELVAESARGGMTVELVDHGGADVPERLGRTAYRIVQEGLTNARRHAPGAAVTVTVDRGSGDGLTVQVRNGPAHDSTVSPGSGHGLLGLTERTTLAGGRLEHGPTADGGFVTSAWLPWPA